MGYGVSFAFLTWSTQGIHHAEPFCSGQEEYERLRPLSYSKAHVILIAFSVDSPDSLDNVSQKVSLLAEPLVCGSL